MHETFIIIRFIPYKTNRRREKKISFKLKTGSKKNGLTKYSSVITLLEIELENNDKIKG